MEASDQLRSLYLSGKSHIYHGQRWFGRCGDEIFSCPCRKSAWIVRLFSPIPSHYIKKQPRVPSLTMSLSISMLLNTFTYFGAFRVSRSLSMHVRYFFMTWRLKLQKHIRKKLLSRITVHPSAHNVLLQHPVALCRSDLGFSTPSMCNVVRCSFVRPYFTACFGPNGHLQVYSLLYFRTLMLTVMRVSFSCCYRLLLFWLCGLNVFNKIKNNHVQPT
jgi:hypothetical protein